jgi:hypothetical protein
MRLSEFTDPKTYALPTDDMAAAIKQLGRVCEEGCGAYPRRSAPCPSGLRGPQGSLTAS